MHLAKAGLLARDDFGEKEEQFVKGWPYGEFLLIRSLSCASSTNNDIQASGKCKIQAI